MSIELLDFVIYAGTHKTATSYIKEKAKQNKFFFKNSKIFVIQNKKTISKIIKNKKFYELRLLLKKLRSSYNGVFNCSDRFYKDLSANIELIKSIWNQAGWRPHIIVGLRDQPDYINSLYCHGIRKFYHNLNFNEYVKQNKNQEKFNYNYLFKNVYETKGIKVTFLPFNKEKSNPFENIMNLTNWNLKFSKEKIKHKNVQIGCKGIFVCKKIYSEKNNDNIKKIKMKIRDISMKEGWQSDRYFGFDNDSYEELREYFRDSNDKFANRIWGCSWEKMFPKKTKVEKREFLDVEDANIEKIVRFLQNQIN
jgi:hypothetical protein